MSWLCDWFGWHMPSPGTEKWLGALLTTRCVRCGREICLDTNGNWVEVGDLP